MPDTIKSTPEDETSKEDPTLQKSSTQENTQQPEAPVNDAQSEGNITQRIEAARKQEKNKLYPTIKQLRTDRSELEEKVSTLEKKSEKLMNDLDKQNEEKQDEEKQNTSAQILAKLEALEQDNLTLREELSETKVQQEVRLEELRLEQYTQQKLQSADLQFPELVKGTTKEEVDAAITQQVEREKVIYDKAREAARQEVESELQDEIGTQVPRPRDEKAPPEPNASKPVNKEAFFNGMSRRDIAQLPPEEFNKVRTQMRQAAQDAQGG